MPRSRKVNPTPSLAWKNLGRSSSSSNQTTWSLINPCLKSLPEIKTSNPFFWPAKDDQRVVIQIGNETAKPAGEIPGRVAVLLRSRCCKPSALM